MNRVTRGVLAILLGASLSTTIFFINKAGLSTCVVMSNTNSERPTRDEPSPPSDEYISFQKFEKLIEHVQKERRQRIERVCQRTRSKMNISSSQLKVALSHILVDDKYKLLYCYVPKVACTNWKRVFLVLQGTFNTTPSQIEAMFAHRQQYFTALSAYGLEARKYRIENYFKFMFARDPLERILSAYMNKFKNAYTDFFLKKYGRTIVRRYRANPSIESLAKGDDVTFPEFVEYLSDRTTAVYSGFNEHWELYHKLCLPCSIRYSYIGLYETLDDDTEYIMRKRNISKLVSLPQQPNSGRTSQLMEEYYGQISPDSLQKLRDVYALDFDLFGYSESQ